MVIYNLHSFSRISAQLRLVFWLFVASLYILLLSCYISLISRYVSWLSRISHYLFVTSRCWIVNSFYLVVTSRYLIVHSGYFGLPVVTHDYVWLLSRSMFQYDRRKSVLLTALPKFHENIRSISLFCSLSCHPEASYWNEKALLLNSF